MATGAGGQDFVLRIVEVLTLAGRGTAVVGPIESGDLRNGEEVEVWDGDRLVASARATLELICFRDADPGSVGLRLRAVDEGLLAPGQTVRRTATTR